MKLLVTGGAGFIGSNFIHYWLNHHAQDEIVNLDSLTYAGNLENLLSVEHNPHYKFNQGDITEIELLDKIMPGIDIVVHFAAESHVDRSIRKPADFMKTNVLGTEILLEVALKHKVKRFHHISTDEVYGSLQLHSQTKFNEYSAYNPRSPYAASKAASDHLVRAYFFTYKLPVTITNCTNNFGPYQHPEKLIPLAITNVLEGKKVPIYGDGLYVRDWLYVKDHCRAIELVLTKGRIGETYCVGGMTDEISNLEVVKRILKIMGKSESVIEYVKDRPGHDRRYAVDCKKIETEFDWKPLYDFDTYLVQTISWYEKNHEWWTHVKNGEYTNYYKKQYQE